MQRNQALLVFAAILGIATGVLKSAVLFSIAAVVSEIFLSLLKLVSLPIIFLSILSTLSGMKDLDEAKTLASKVIKYTLLTTLLAATCALGIFAFVQPVTDQTSARGTSIGVEGPNYLSHLRTIIPSNFVQPFVENNVLGVFFIAAILSLAILSLPRANREILHAFFSSLYATILKITQTLVRFVPLAIWAFISLFFKDLESGLDMKDLALYLICIVSANLIQAFLILPTLLKVKGISPTRIANGMLPALSVAFFTKSSNAALPMAIECAEKRLGTSKRVADFSFPLCTTINMNGCAAFILITVLFVGTASGIHFSAGEKILWIFVSTLAAIGNAGVPMGCFFLSGALLSAMNVPLHLLGVILPFYSFIDMLETAINVWSDSCVAVIVDKELNQ